MSLPHGLRLRGVPIAECHDCGDPIRFVRLDTGSAMPVNPAGNPDGNVAAVKVGNRLHGHVVSKAKPARPGALMFTPHAATCPAIERPPPKPKPAPHPSLF